MIFVVPYDWLIFFCLAVWRMSSEFWKEWKRFCRLLLVTAIFMMSILPFKEHGSSFHCLVSSLLISWHFHYRIFSFIWIGLFCFYFSDYECNISLLSSFAWSFLVYVKIINFLRLSLYSGPSLKVFIRSESRTFKYRIMSCANKDSFTFFLFLIPFVSFYCLIILAKISCWAIGNKIVKSETGSVSPYLLYCCLRVACSGLCCFDVCFIHSHCL